MFSILSTERKILNQNFDQTFKNIKQKEKKDKTKNNYMFFTSPIEQSLTSGSMFNLYNYIGLNNNSKLILVSLENLFVFIFFNLTKQKRKRHV